LLGKVKGGVGGGE
jgi:hypothetical protein